MRRYLEAQVRRDLQRKMVLVAGPRQVGKATLARTIQPRADSYLNWDVPEHRARILRGELPVTKCLVLDEVHKFRRWRNYLKGLYDHPGRRYRILVTGSARLDLYRFGGDSLQGRYHLLRLHPFTVAELGMKNPTELESLLELGGFPEPFLGGSKTEAARWSHEYRSRLLREDVASLERIADLGSLELLMLRLPGLVGSPLSINALREDLQVNHRTVAKWLAALERLYSIFRLPPLGSPRIRAVKKSQKHYHLDWSLVEEPGARFENLVSVHLLKWVHFEQDTKGRPLELRYFRDVTGREVDFVVTEKARPILLVECKLSEGEVSKHLLYLKERFPAAEAYQLSARGKRDWQTPSGVRVCPALVLLKTLI
jgi:predicted AAA+ superfamily ATPase